MWNTCLGITPPKEQGSSLYIYTTTSVHHLLRAASGGAVSLDFWPAVCRDRAAFHGSRESPQAQRCRCEPVKVVWGSVKQKIHGQWQWSVPGHLLSWLRPYLTAHCMDLWPQRMDAENVLSVLWSVYKSFRIKCIYILISIYELAKPALYGEAVNEVCVTL